MVHSLFVFHVHALPLLTVCNSSNPDRAPCLISCTRMVRLFTTSLFTCCFDLFLISFTTLTFDVFIIKIVKVMMMKN